MQTELNLRLFTGSLVCLLALTACHRDGEDLCERVDQQLKLLKVNREKHFADLPKLQKQCPRADELLKQASFCSASGNRKRAYELTKQALFEQQAVLGKDNVKLSDTWARLGGLPSDEPDVYGWYPCLSEIYRLRRLYFGPDSRDSVASLCERDAAPPNRKESAKLILITEQDLALIKGNDVPSLIRKAELLSAIARLEHKLRSPETPAKATQCFEILRSNKVDPSKVPFAADRRLLFDCWVTLASVVDEAELLSPQERLECFNQAFLTANSLPNKHELSQEKLLEFLKSYLLVELRSGFSQRSTEIATKAKALAVRYRNYLTPEFYRLVEFAVDGPKHTPTEISEFVLKLKMEVNAKLEKKEKLIYSDWYDSDRLSKLLTALSTSHPKKT